MIIITKMDSLWYFAHISLILILNSRCTLGKWNDCECPGTIKRINRVRNTLQKDVVNLKLQNKILTSRIDKLEMILQENPSMTMSSATKGTATVHNTTVPVMSAIIQNTTEGPTQDKGFCFDGSPSTRLEYEFLPVSLRIRYVLSMEFRTKEADGVMFYFSDRNDMDHISVVMTEGRIRYTFNCGTGTAEIKSTRMYNDGNWHKLEVERRKSMGVLKVDEDLSPIVYSPGPAGSVNGRPPYYFGGLDQANLPEERAVTNLGSVSKSFIGCIANIKVGNYKDLMLGVGTPSKQIGIQPCLDSA